MKRLRSSTNGNVSLDECEEREKTRENEREKERKTEKKREREKEREKETDKERERTIFFKVSKRRSDA